MLRKVETEVLAGSGGVAGGAQREREITQNSELYYTRIKILGLFLQSVPANLHAKRIHIKQ